tara:strand:+ start:346 stop:480 length:135 start_codon:yes stop_codon:yes gene_type:complete
MSYKVIIELEFEYKPNQDDVVDYVRDMYEDNTLDYKLIDNKKEE